MSCSASNFRFLSIEADVHCLAIVIKFHVSLINGATAYGNTEKKVYKGDPLMHFP